MKKIITILGTISIAGSPALALNSVSYKTQNFQNILQPTIAKSNGSVNNDIIVQSVSSYQFYFQARLSNSTYNGFPGFMNQIKVGPWPLSWPLYFFQWLDDDDFDTMFFPELQQHTAQGFFHDPMVWANRLEEHMDHFGAWYDYKSNTAHNMISGKNAASSWKGFGKHVVSTYNNAAATGNVAGIMLNFGFTYDGSKYSVVKPNCDVIMSP